MESIKVFDDIYMFTDYLSFIDLSFNRFLLSGPEPVLVHTGSRDQAAVLLPEVEKQLGGRSLSYILISHFESDECGGLGLFLERYPNAKPVCSTVTARQLAGFGLASGALAKTPGQVLEGGGFRLRFIGYPSEMHLWEGLLAFEEIRGLLFSSDLFIRRGAVKVPVVDSSLKEELGGMPPEQVPDPGAYKDLQRNLGGLPVKYILPGHGPCLKV